MLFVLKIEQKSINIIFLLYYCAIQELFLHLYSDAKVLWAESDALW